MLTPFIYKQSLLIKFFNNPISYLEKEISFSVNMNFVLFSNIISILIYKYKIPISMFLNCPSFISPICTKQFRPKNM